MRPARRSLRFTATSRRRGDEPRRAPAGGTGCLSAPPAAYEATLDNCHREPIHIPGSIQPHGALVAFDAGAGAVLHASTNLKCWLPTGDLPMRGRAMSDLFGADAYAAILQGLTGQAGVAMRHQVVDLPARPEQQQPAAFEVLVHTHRGVSFAEFEPACPPEKQQDWAQLFGDTIDAMRSAGDLDELISRTALRVKRLTGFDRVMVYRFDDEWNGHVIADAHEADMESFHDLHYPASDIPVQARELYRSNLVRYIADVGYEPVPVLPWLDSERLQPLDMSHATLRSVSPMHVRYLQNMDVGSTLTMSLLVDDRLWGLIACHHRTPHFLPVRLRRACHALSVTAGYMVGWHEQRQQSQRLAKLAHAQSRIVEAFNQVQAPLPEVIEQCSSPLLHIAHAVGGAFWRNGTVLQFGQWPGGLHGDAILSQARHELEISALDLWQTDVVTPAPARAADSGRQSPMPGRAFGLMAIRLDAFASAGIVWLRPEFRREVSWGGDPDKPVQVDLDAEGRPVLSPRASFARWLTVVQGRCRPWTETDVQAARSLRPLVTVLTVRDALDKVGLSDRRFRSLVALQSDAYCQLDTQGRITTLSKPLPIGPGPVDGQALTALLAPHCDSAEVGALEQALRSQQPCRGLRLHGRATDDHAEFVLDVSGEPLNDQAGRCIGWHGTITDMTLAVAVQTALRLKEAAELSNVAKSKFLSQMSHELRTPLNAVLGFSQLLLMDGTVTQPQRDKIRHIQRAGDWLLEMIADLMDLSQIETGNLALKLEAVELRSVIAETLDLVEAQAAGAGVRMVNERNDAAAWVRADRSRLKQVLVNLVSNALKYNRTHGDVHVAVQFDAALHTTRVEVRDSGAGLTSEQLAQLFQPFNRLGRENRSIQGTGIGLVIAKQLVEAMGGQIIAESRPGHGSTFSVVLADALPEIERPDDSAGPSAPPSPGDNRVVLYVGDDASNVVLVESIVESLPGVRLVHADTAERALELSRDLHPSVVLIDIKLSGLPGMHLLKSIKADPDLRHLRCIAIDASAAGEALDELSSAGFEDRWLKPLDLKMIASGLGAVLSS